jgi:hypothetical protein
MSNDFDVITGPPVSPGKIRPAAAPVADRSPSPEAEKMASVPKDRPTAKEWAKP